VPVIAFFKDTDNGIWFQDLNNTIINNVYDFRGRLTSDVNLYRPCYKSVTTALNVTMFNDTGMVAGSQFNPPLMFAGSLAVMADKHPAQFRAYVRHCLKAGHKIIKASKCTFTDWPKHVRDDIQDIVSQHVERSSTLSDIMSRAAIQSDDFELFTIDLDPSVAIQFVSFGELPDPVSIVPSIDAMLNNDTRSATFPAKEGTFTINHLNTVAPKWMTTGVGRGNTAALQTQLYKCYVAYNDPNGLDHFVPFSDPSPVGTLLIATRTMTDAQWSSDMTWQWVQYQGLSYNGNQDAVTLQQLIATKWITGCEYQPAFLSPFAGLQKLGPKPDIMAMEALMRDFYEFKSVLPAKYNFLGMLARGAMKLLPSVIKYAPKIIKGLTSVSDFDDSEKARKPKKLEAAKKDIERAERTSNPAKAKQFIQKAIKNERLESIAEEAEPRRSRPPPSRPPRQRGSAPRRSGNHPNRRPNTKFRANQKQDKEGVDY